MDVRTNARRRTYVQQRTARRNPPTTARRDTRR